MTRDYTCIICPNGCDLTVEVENGEIRSLAGALCGKGEEYVRQELHDPRRNIASSALVLEGELPLVSVRLTAPIPKARIFDVMDEIKRLKLTAPLDAGQTLICDVLGLGVDVITTKQVGRAKK